jgi:hypothetical protein
MLVSAYPSDAAAGPAGAAAKAAATVLRKSQ